MAVSRAGAAMVGAVVAASVSTGAAIGALSLSPRPLLIAATASLVALPVVRRVSAKRFDPLEPIFLFALAYGVMFVVRPLSMLHSGDLVYRIAGRGIGIEETFDRMLLLGAVGATGLVAGYELTHGERLARRVRRPRAGVSESRLLAVTSGFAALGVVLFGAFIWMKGGSEGISLVFSGRSAQLTEAVNDSSKYLYFGPMLLIPAALVALAVGLRTRRTSTLLFAAGLALCVLVMRGPVGSRMTLLPLIGGALTYLCLTRARRPGVLVVTATLVAALTLSTFLLAIRDATQREQAGLHGAITRIVDDPVVVFDPLLQGQDAAEAPALAAALTLIPNELQHTYGRSVAADLLTRPVPRSLWPGKPLPPREQAVSLLWPGLYRNANPEFTPLLAFYLDGGLLGVLVGMFAYGTLLRFGYGFLRLHQANLTVRLIYALALPATVILLRDGLTDTVARAAFLLVPLLVAHRVAAPASRPAVRAQSRPLPGFRASTNSDPGL